jgi:hypothetical protein
LLGKVTSPAQSIPESSTEADIIEPKERQAASHFIVTMSPTYEIAPMFTAPKNAIVIPKSTIQRENASSPTLPGDIDASNVDLLPEASIEPPKLKPASKLFKGSNPYLHRLIFVESIRCTRYIALTKSVHILASNLQ